MVETRLPYGVLDLDPKIIVHPDDPDRIRCYVRGCQRFLRRPTRYAQGKECPDHGIYCHYSRYGATYSYRDVRRNIIASPELFAQRIVGHPFKYESHRLGSENSEDALSWNFFRSMQEAGLLAAVAKLITGEDHPQEPNLYLWGIRVSDDSFEPWDLLNAARERFESNLPVKRPLTEPDIALYLPGKYLVLIEAKFTSQNPVYERGPRKDAQSLTFHELLEIYWDASLQILDLEAARSADCVHYQLWRNMVFAEWMARLDGSETRPFHVNLVRARSMEPTAPKFQSLLRPASIEHFIQVSWETLSRQLAKPQDIIHKYLRVKTCHLSKAFDLGP